MEQVVWVPEPKDGFVLATIVDLGMDEVTVQPVGTSKARFTLPLDRVYTADPHFDNKDVDDNCMCSAVFFFYEQMVERNLYMPSIYRFSDAFERSHVIEQRQNKILKG